MSRLNILCVDDEADILEVIRLSLQMDPAISVRTAATGNAALAVLSLGEWPVHGIILDMRVAGEHGLLLLGEIRNLQGHEKTPVIMLTAHVRPEYMDRYQRFGAVQMIAKPFDPVLLAGDVRRILSASP